MSRRLVDELKDAKVKAQAIYKDALEIEIERERAAILEKLTALPLIPRFAAYRENAEYFAAEGFDVDEAGSYAGYKITIP